MDNNNNNTSLKGIETTSMKRQVSLPEEAKNDPNLAKILRKMIEKEKNEKDEKERTSLLPLVDKNVGIHRTNPTVNPKTKKRKRKRQSGGKRRRRNRRRTRKKGRKRNTGKKRKHRRKKSKKSKRRGGVKMPSINKQPIKRKVISPRKKLSTPQVLIDPLKVWVY